MRAGLVLAVVLAATTAARAQELRPRSRTLEARQSAAPPFEALVRGAAAQLLGDRIPQLDEGLPLASAVLVVVRVDGVSVWDVPAAPLAAGRFPPGALRACPGPCSVPLRDAVARALVEHQEALAGEDAETRVLVLPDAELPWGTVPVVLRSIAAATHGAPPALGLVARTPAGLAQVPLLAPPPQPVRLRPAAHPLLLEVEVEPAGTFVARTSPFFGKGPVPARTLAALGAFVGHLKSRDPGKQVAFLSAPDALPLRRVMPALAVVRAHYPALVVKPRGPLPIQGLTAAAARE